MKYFKSLLNVLVGWNFSLIGNSGRSGCAVPNDMKKISSDNNIETLEVKTHWFRGLDIKLIKSIMENKGNKNLCVNLSKDFKLVSDVAKDFFEIKVGDFNNHDVFKWVIEKRKAAISAGIFNDKGDILKRSDVFRLLKDELEQQGGDILSVRNIFSVSSSLIVPQPDNKGDHQAAINYYRDVIYDCKHIMEMG